MHQTLFVFLYQYWGVHSVAGRETGGFLDIKNEE